MANDGQVMKALYTMVAESIIPGTSISEKDFFTFSNGGVLIRPDLDESNLRHLHEQTQALDFILDSSFFEERRPGTVSEVWREIVEFAELPQRILSRDDEKEIEKLVEYIDKYEERYWNLKDTYLIAQETYLAAIEAEA